MEPKIPLPTDSLYKFGALFGLTLTIACMVFQVVNVNTANDRINQYREAIFEADDGPENNKELKIAAYTNQINAAKKDHALYATVLSALMGAGGGIALIGFVIWGCRVQPIQIAMLKLEKQQLELEVALLEEELKAKQAANLNKNHQGENNEPHLADDPARGGHSA